VAASAEQGDRHRKDGQNMCEKRPQIHGNGLAVRRSTNQVKIGLAKLLYHQYSSGTAGMQSFFTVEDKRDLWKLRATRYYPEGVGQHIVCIDGGYRHRQYKQLVGGAPPSPRDERSVTI